MFSVLYGACKIYNPGSRGTFATPPEFRLKDSGVTEMTLELMVVNVIGQSGTAIGACKGAETVVLKSWFENICTDRIPGFGRGASAGLRKLTCSGSAKLCLSIRATEREATTMRRMTATPLTSLDDLAARELTKPFSGKKSGAVTKNVSRVPIPSP
jgi:hypothetical protein